MGKSGAILLENSEGIPIVELDKLLGHFLKIKVRKIKGKEYEPETLTTFQRSYDLHLGQPPRSIVTKREFEGSPLVLQAKRKDQRGKGRVCGLVLF